MRVPLRYSLFESEDAEGFKLLDRLIVWSRAEDLWSAPHPRLAVAHLGHPETLLILGFPVVHAYPAGIANQLPLLRHARAADHRHSSPRRPRPRPTDDRLRLP